MLEPCLAPGYHRPPGERTSASALWYSSVLADEMTFQLCSASALRFALVAHAMLSTRWLVFPLATLVVTGSVVVTMQLAGWFAALGCFISERLLYTWKGMGGAGAAAAADDAGALMREQII